MCAFMPSIFSLRSSSNPVMTDRTMISAVTPTVIPSIDMNVMTEIKVGLLFALRYLKPINHS